MELTKSGYEFGGVLVSELTKNYGTPLYVYDSDVIVNNYHNIPSLRPLNRFHCHPLEPFQRQ